MATKRALQEQFSDKPSTLYIALELAKAKWLVAIGAASGKPRHYVIDGGSIAALWGCISHAKQWFGTTGSPVIHSCYEAGRDGFWLHRYLVRHGINNVVVDAASIEMPRKARRAKTDRIDVRKLLDLLMRYADGAKRVWQVVRVPSEAEEDARRVYRERERLVHERSGHSQRIKGLLFLHNVRVERVGGRDWQAKLASWKDCLPTHLYTELLRENERLTVVDAQLKALQAEMQPTDAAEKRLQQLKGIGWRGACGLGKEMLWRDFHNRREVAGYLGLAPTPYASGDKATEQGISKAGNRRLRSLLVELSWDWLRYQPQSELSQWYGRRFAQGGKRMRRIGIVALARRLAIALWRYATAGVPPVGAELKTA